MTAHSQTLGLLRGQIGFLAKHLDVLLVAKDTGNLQQLAQQEGVRCCNVEMLREISPLRDLRSLVALVKLFRRERPDIVHANTPKGALLGLLAAWVARVPHRIYNVNGLRFETTSGNLRRLLIFMEKIACACATKVIPQSNGVANVLRREHITRKPLQVILNGSGNGVDLERFNPQNADIQAKAKVIRGNFDGTAFVFVGRVVRDKGINELAEAFNRLSSEFSNVRLHIVGAYEDSLDPISEEARQIIDSNDRIITHGSQPDVRPFLAASNVFVLPSYREGFPNVVLEAGAMGLPVIVSDVNGAPDAITDGVNGRLIPKANTEALYKAMRQLHTDTTLRHQMASKAREMIATRFDRHQIWQAILEMYQSL